MCAYASIVCIAMIFNAAGEAGNVDSLINSLLSRQATLSKGTVRFTQYRFIASNEFCDMVTGMIKDKTKSLDDMRAVINRAATHEKIIPLAQYTGVICYDDERWHLSRARVENFSIATRRALEKRAKEKGARLLPQLTLEEVAYNGEYVTVLEDNEKLIKRALDPTTKYTRLSDIDVTFLPWNEMRAAQPQPGETNSVVSNPTTATMNQTWQDGAKGKWVFSIVDGYGPLHVELISPPSVVANEKTYRIVRTSASLPVVQVAIDRDRERDGRYRVNCWLVSDWSSDVDEKDLSIAPPTGSYVSIDDRFGQGVPKVVQEGSGLQSHGSFMRALFILANVLVVIGLLFALLYRRMRMRR
jgi:hypothetical protein